MKLYIYYKGKSAGIEYEHCDAFLNPKAEHRNYPVMNKQLSRIPEGYNTVTYFVQVDKGLIAFTTSPFKKGGRPIDPKGKIGRQLIKLAKEWINNPETIWRKDYWHAIWHRRKYSPFPLN